MARPQIDINLSDCIGPAFEDVFNDVMSGGHTFYDLYGGRGSLKSSFVSFVLPLGIMMDPTANGIVFRKVANTVGSSVYEQVLWGIDQLQVSEYWKATKSPYKLTYKPTGQVILFRGLDDWSKAKSIKVAKGYFKYVWFEELDQFAGAEEIRGVQQSLLRGGPSFTVFRTFNPPISQSNWANEFVLTPQPDALRHKSCYLDAPREWLGEQFINDAELLKEINPRAYEHEYLGVPTGTGGEVFENLQIREISDDEIKRFDYIYEGLDFGWYPDPLHWSKMHYDSARLTLYIFDEFRANKMSNRGLFEALTKQKKVSEDLIIADSAEPKSIGDLQNYGLRVRGAVKGPDSVRYGIKWLQSLKAIVIDPARCPATAKEFSAYEYERTPDGEVMSGYPDENNHSIDSVRYGMEPVWKRRGR